MTGIDLIIGGHSHSFLYSNSSATPLPVLNKGSNLTDAVNYMVRRFDIKVEFPFYSCSAAPAGGKAAAACCICNVKAVLISTRTEQRWKLQAVLRCSVRRCVGMLCLPLRRHWTLQHVRKL